VGRRHCCKYPLCGMELPVSQSPRSVDPVLLGDEVVDGLGGVILSEPLPNFTPVQGAGGDRSTDQFILGLEAVMDVAAHGPRESLARSHLLIGEGQQGVQRGLERSSAPLYLRKEKSPLEHSEERDSEIVRVDVGRELPVGLKGVEPVADGS